METLDVKIEAISELKTSDVAIVANENKSRPYEKLTYLFKGSEITEEEILDLVGILFILESLILSEKMRDVELTNLDQGQVENLAMELFLLLERKRSRGNGYSEMCETANEVISKHLSSIKGGAR